MSHNRLAQEKSPYLLQHRSNPVWWFPWGDEAFVAAKKENKMIFLSVGYSTCHWCHVMEKDSFEKHDVADALNKNYISVKVDREERPDVDSFFMNAVQSMTGRGGWPMSVLLTPEGKPFWGGTFVAHDGFITLLERAAELWKNNPAEITKSGEQLTVFLREQNTLPAAEGAPVSTGPLQAFYHGFKNHFDPVHGGSEGAPKFPQALALMALLRVHRRTGAPDALNDALNMTEFTLDQMRRGGVYDQLGGGFHRYSVDEEWLIPHFEKMLYDNALLARAFLELFQVARKPEHERTAREILDYVLKDMTDPRHGGFYSAEDADSEGIEGKFYVWTSEELRKILSPEEYDKIKLMFHLEGAGNFSAHRTGDEVSPNARSAPPALEGHVFHLKTAEPLPAVEEKVVASAFEKMRKVRAQRIRPHLDDKVITSWNGLMISAMAGGFQVLGERKYLDGAYGAARFILSSLKDKGGFLLRTYRDGESRHRALAEDYACLIEALLHLYECEFDERWFEEAAALQEKQDRLFWDRHDGGYFDGDGSDPQVLIRQKTFEDNVVPSPNSVSCLNLLRLFALTGHVDYEQKALAILKAAGTLVEKYPSAVSKLLQSLDRLTDFSPQLAVAADFREPATSKFLLRLRKHFQPNLSLALGNNSPQPSAGGKIPLLQERPVLEGKITFYLCEGMSCKLPTHDSELIFQEISKCKIYKPEAQAKAKN